MPPAPLDILRAAYGYDAFRNRQSEVIDHVTAGGSGLQLAPTGGGKSLCYQIPALLRTGTGIVVSPLIALMQEQVAALEQLGERAAFLNSTLTPAEQRAHRAMRPRFPQGIYEIRRPGPLGTPILVGF